MRLKFPHFPRFISATLFPVTVRILLWVALMATVGISAFLALTQPLAFTSDIVGVLRRPGDSVPHQTLADRFWETGNRALAKREIQLASEYGSVLGVSTKLSEREEEQHIEYWTSIINTYPDYVDGYIQLASLYYLKGDVNRALTHLRQAQVLDPNNETVSDLLRFTSSLLL